MWRRPLEWNLNGTTDPRDGSVDHLSLNSLKDRHGPIRAPKSPAMAADRGAVAFGDDVAGSEPRCPRPYDAVAPQRRVVLGHRPGRAGWSGHRGDRQHRLEGFRRR